MKKVYTAEDLPDAYIVLNLLTEAGIDATILNENARGGMGEIPFNQAYPEVWVIENNDFAKAREIINNYEHTDMKQKALRCQACGEENPANFEICWQCGNKLPT